MPRLTLRPTRTPVASLQLTEQEGDNTPALTSRLGLCGAAPALLVACCLVNTATTFICHKHCLGNLAGINTIFYQSFVATVLSNNLAFYLCKLISIFHNRQLDIIKFRFHSVIVQNKLEVKFRISKPFRFSTRFTKRQPAYVVVASSQAVRLTA